MTQDSTQTVLFSDLFPKSVVASFDQPDSSSDGGAILLKTIDSGLALTERLASCAFGKRVKRARSFTRWLTFFVSGYMESHADIRKGVIM